MPSQIQRGETGLNWQQPGGKWAPFQRSTACRRFVSVPNSVLATSASSQSHVDSGTGISSRYCTEEGSKRGKNSISFMSTFDLRRSVLLQPSGSGALGFIHSSQSYNAAMYTVGNK